MISSVATEQTVQILQNNDAINALDSGTQHKVSGADQSADEPVNLWYQCLKVKVIIYDLGNMVGAVRFHGGF